MLDTAAELYVDWNARAREWMLSGFLEPTILHDGPGVLIFRHDENVVVVTDDRDPTSATRAVDALAFAEPGVHDGYVLLADELVDGFAWVYPIVSDG